MVSYDEIKSEAVRIHNDKSSPEVTIKLAAVALCDRVAKLEQRHRDDIQRLENWLRNMRQ